MGFRLLAQTLENVLQIVTRTKKTGNFNYKTEKYLPKWYFHFSPH